MNSSQCSAVRKAAPRRLGFPWTDPVFNKVWYNPQGVGGALSEEMRKPT